MPGRFVCALLALGTLWSGSPAPGSAMRLGPVLGSAATDGRGLIAWYSDSDQVRVLNALTGRVQSYRPPSDPRCPSPSMAVGAGELLFTCADEPVLIDLGSGVAHRPADGSTLTDGLRARECEYVQWTQVGRHWIEGSCGHLHGSSPMLWDWHAEHYGVPPAYDDRRRQVDVNAPRGVLTLCSPAERPKSPDEFDTGLNGPYLDLAYERPWFLPPRAETTSRLVVQHCGRSRPTTIERCPDRCRLLTLGAGLMTWMSGDRVRWSRPGRRPHTIGASHAAVWLVHAARIVVATRVTGYTGAGYPTADLIAWRLPGAPSILRRRR